MVAALGEPIPKLMIVIPSWEALVAKLIEQGKEVFYVAFSACEQSVLPQFPKDILITEVKAATSTLGISEDHLILKRFDVRTFNYHRQEILDILIQLREEIKPDTVLIPSLNDIHQDHKTIAEEALRAFKFINVLSYELPWNNLVENFGTQSYFTCMNYAQFLLGNTSSGIIETHNRDHSPNRNYHHDSKLNRMQEMC